jgi:hypothetical protein
LTAGRPASCPLRLRGWSWGGAGQDVWIGLWLERRGSRSDINVTSGVMLSSCHSSKVALERAGLAPVREDCDATLWFYDDAAQPQLNSIPA